MSRISANANPEIVRTLFVTYSELLERARALRSQMERDHEPLPDRVAAGIVIADLERDLEAARSWLRRTAKRGGRGTPPPGAGRRPAAMGHGWPAVAVPAVGPAPGILPGAGAAAPAAQDPAAVPANPLFSGSPGQDLPQEGESDHTQPQLGSHLHG